MDELHEVRHPDWRARATGGWDDASKEEVLAMIPDSRAINVSLGLDVLAALHKRAHDLHCSRSKVVSDALRAHLMAP